MSAVYAAPHAFGGIGIVKRLVATLACCALCVSAWTQDAKPSKGAPADEVKIPYPDWLFPIDEEALKAAKTAAKAAANAAAKPAPKEVPNLASNFCNTDLPFENRFGRPPSQRTDQFWLNTIDLLK